MSKVLVVEDEFLIAATLADMLTDAGYEVIGPAGSAKQAFAQLAREKPDFAVLDVNLGDHRIDPVADYLTERDVPFVFVTGYGREALPEKFTDIRLIGKPVREEDFLRELEDLMPSGSA